MRDYVFPAHLEPAQEGGFIVTFPDLPEATTQGDDRAEALKAAADCLSEALAARLHHGEEIPAASKGSAFRKQPHAGPRLMIAAKAALSDAMKAENLSNVAFAARLGVGEKAVRDLLDPSARSKLPRIEAALAALGQTLVLSVKKAA